MDLVWGEGISRQCSVERWIWTSRSLIRQITGLFSKTLLFSWMPFLYTHHQPNTLTIMIPICSLTQWHKWYLLFYALVILRLLRKCQKKKKSLTWCSLWFLPSALLPSFLFFSLVKQLKKEMKNCGTPSVLVYSGCHNKVPQPGWCKQQRFTIWQFWRLEDQDQGISRVVSSWGLSWLVDGCVLPVSSHGLPHVFISSFL